MNHTTSGCVCAVRVQCVWFEYIYTYPHISRKLYSTCVHTTHAVYACKYIFNVLSGLTVVECLSDSLARGVVILMALKCLGRRRPYYSYGCVRIFFYRVVFSGHRGFEGRCANKCERGAAKIYGLMGVCCCWEGCECVTDSGHTTLLWRGVWSRVAPHLKRISKPDIVSAPVRAAKQQNVYARNQKRKRKTKSESYCSYGAIV